MTEGVEPAGRSHKEAPATNTLVVTSVSASTREISWFERVKLPKSRDVAALFVTTRSPTDCLSAWESTVGDLPATIAVVSETNQGKATIVKKVNLDRDLSVAVRPVADMTDLIEVGIRISELLEEWKPAEHRLVVCFEALTEQLHHTNSSHLYRFLAACTSRLEAGDALGYFLIDADAPDEKDIEVMKSLFDDVVHRGSHALSTTGTRPQSKQSRGDPEAITEGETDTGFIYPEEDSRRQNPRTTSADETRNGGDSDQ